MRLSNMAITKELSLTDLQVNTENYRFEPVASQKEAIDKIVKNQGDKLINLSKDILSNGLNPNDKIQVVASKHDKTKYNVLEGNRRTVALKLLNIPDLIDDEKYSWLKKKFKKLHDENKSQIKTEVECIIYDDPKEAEHWIGIKHGYGESGISTEGWDPYQKDRFQDRTEGKSSIVYQSIKFLQNSPDVPAQLKEDLKGLNTSNLKRLLDDPSVRKLLGVEINNGILQSKVDEKEVVKGLTKIVQDVLNPNFKVINIYTKQDREDYIKKFSKESTPNTSKLSAQPWQLNSGPSLKEPLKGLSIRPNPLERKKLIPPSCSLKINKPKLNAIYYELKKMDIYKFTNAASFSLRVFVELSMDCYIEEHGLTAAPSSAKSGTDLQQKVFQVSGHLKNKGWADDTITKGIKVAVKDTSSLLSIDTWHAYIHNNRFSPSAPNLIHTWDNIQPFLEKVWQNIKT